jgi:hypothetical protein
MKVETIVNGGVTLVLVPENDLDEAMLKQLALQENEITEIRSGATVLNRTFNQGLVIQKKPKEVERDLPPANPESDESKE